MLHWAVPFRWFYYGKILKEGGALYSMIKKPGSLPPKSNSSAKEAQKIANLEKSIAEKDNIIAQLKEVIRTLKEVC